MAGVRFANDEEDAGDGCLSPGTYAPGIGKMSGVLPSRRRSCPMVLM